MTTPTLVNKKSRYHDYIVEDLKRLGLGRKNYDPRHIEAYMRIASGTIDHLAPHMFRAEVHIATSCVDFGGKHQAELCAKSFGL